MMPWGRGDAQPSNSAEEQPVVLSRRAFVSRLWMRIFRLHSRECLQPERSESISVDGVDAPSFARGLPRYKESLSVAELAAVKILVERIESSIGDISNLHSILPMTKQDTSISRLDFTRILSSLNISNIPTPGKAPQKTLETLNSGSFISKRNDQKESGELFRLMHKALHQRCTNNWQNCRLSVKDFKTFWDFHAIECKIRDFVIAHLPHWDPDEHPMEGLIRIVENGNETLFARTFDFLENNCVAVRPRLVFNLLVHKNGLERLWSSVKKVISGNNGMLFIWWSFLCRVLRDAAAVSDDPSLRGDPNNDFYNPAKSGKKRSKADVTPTELLQCVWTLYHPRNVLYAIGDAVNLSRNASNETMEKGWRLLDQGAVEFLAEKKVGLARLRDVMRALVSVKYHFDLTLDETYNQLFEILHVISKLDSVLKASSTFCLAAALYGVPFYLELLEWWLRECSTVSSNAEAMDLSNSIIANLQSQVDRMENYLCFIYKGDEDTEPQKDETSDATEKAIKAKDELHNDNSRGRWKWAISTLVERHRSQNQQDALLVSMNAGDAILKPRRSVCQKTRPNSRPLLVRQRSEIGQPSGQVVEDAWSKLLASLNAKKQRRVNKIIDKPVRKKREKKPK
eukprot:GEMP01030647.1.p1 GENE.GEMP01030647.1~~GEMP01030647.1.p1  ORF type:complete len:627 (+),score=105.00 GEMP01030647.1:300-2180(+)